MIFGIVDFRQARVLGKRPPNLRRGNFPSDPVASDPAVRFPMLLLEAWIFCLPLLCITVILKILVLRESGDPRFFELSLRSSYLRMFAGEVWESLVIVPVILICLGWILPTISRKLLGWRRSAYLLLVELLLVDAIVQWVTYRTMGEFPTRDLAGDFFTTLRTNPAFLSPANLLDKKEQFMFLVALLAGVGSLLISYFWMPRIRSLWLKHYKWSFAIVILALSAVGMAPTGVSGTNFDRVGTLQRTVAEALKSNVSDEIITPEESRASPKDLYARLVYPGGSRQRPRAGNTASLLVPPTMPDPM